MDPACNKGSPYSHLHFHLALKNHHAMRKVKVSKGTCQGSFVAFYLFVGSFVLHNATVDGGVWFCAQTDRVGFSLSCEVPSPELDLLKRQG